MHGAGVLCAGSRSHRLLFNQVHSANRAVAGPVVGFVAFAMHWAIESSRPNRFYFFGLGGFLWSFARKVYAITATVFLQSFLKVFDRNVVFHFNNGFSFLQVYRSFGNASYL